MKISFIVPPSLDGLKPAERSAGCTRLVYPMPNIYELTVAAIFEKLNHQVEYHDFVIKRQTEKDFQTFIRLHQTDIFCIWSVNLSFETDKKAVDIIRIYHPFTWILFMGPGATYFSNKYLTDKRVVVVRGEPEIAATNLLNAVEYRKPFNSLKGISFLDNYGKVIRTPPEDLIKNLDLLPFPSRHLTNGVIYRNVKLKYSPCTSVITSRNCPYGCIYCVPGSLTFAREIESRVFYGTKPPITFRSVENIDNELELLAGQGFKSIAFIDDNFIWNTNRLQGIINSLNKFGFHWGCQTRADTITQQIAGILANSNCDYIDLGVESFNNEILKFIHKGMTEEQIINSISILNQHNIPVKLNILIGASILETRKTIRDTIHKAKMLKASQVMINIVSPFPGTRFYEMAKENNWIKGGEYRPTDVQQESLLEYPHIKAKEMESILFWSNVAFFIRPSIILKHVRQFRSFRDFYCALRSFIVKMFGI